MSMLTLYECVINVCIQPKFPIQNWTVIKQWHFLIIEDFFVKKTGSLEVSGKLPTYPSLKSTLTLTSHLGQNVGLGEG